MSPCSFFTQPTKCHEQNQTPRFTQNLQQNRTLENNSNRSEDMFIFKDKQRVMESNSSGSKNSARKDVSVCFLKFFKRFRKKSSGAWRLFEQWKKSWTFSKSSTIFSSWIVDGFLFKIVSVFEGVVLVSALCFFFLCCGCHF